MLKDPFAQFVSCGLHFDGAEGSTTFTDIKGGSFSVAGNAKITTSHKAPLVGNTSCGYFDGWARIHDTYSTGICAFGTGDFTIELWLRPVNAGKGSVWARVAETAQYPLQNGWALVMTNANGENPARIGFQQSSGAFLLFSSRPLYNDVWVHLAFVRASGRLMLFLNGKLDGETTYTDDLWRPGFAIGGSLDGSWRELFNGFVDDFRVTKAARYTSDFYVPDVPFADYKREVAGRVLDPNGGPAVRELRVYRRDSGLLIAKGNSISLDGSYSIGVNYDGEVQVVMVDNDGGIVENDQILRTTPV